MRLSFFRAIELRGRVEGARLAGIRHRDGGHLLLSAFCLASASSSGALSLLPDGEAMMAFINFSIALFANACIAHRTVISTEVCHLFTVAECRPRPIATCLPLLHARKRGL